MQIKLFSRFVRALALLIALGASSHAMADVARLVTLDTSVYGVRPGFLDFTFNGADGAPAATATVSQLHGFNMDPANFLPPQGDAWLVPGGFAMLNSINMNDVAYQAMFGNVFSFVLTVSGDASALLNSNFGIIAYDENLLPIKGKVLDLMFAQAPDGSPDLQILSINNAIATVGDAPVAAVPEPASLALAALGLLMLGLVRRRRA